MERANKRIAAPFWYVVDVRRADVVLENVSLADATAYVRQRCLKNPHLLVQRSPYWIEPRRSA